MSHDEPLCEAHDKLHDEFQCVAHDMFHDDDELWQLAHKGHDELSPMAHDNCDELWQVLYDVEQDGGHEQLDEFHE